MVNQSCIKNQRQCFETKCTKYSCMNSNSCSKSSTNPIRIFSVRGTWPVQSSWRFGRHSRAIRLLITSAAPVFWVTQSNQQNILIISPEGIVARNWFADCMELLYGPQQHRAVHWGRHVSCSLHCLAELFFLGRRWCPPLCNHAMLRSQYEYKILSFLLNMNATLKMSLINET